MDDEEKLSCNDKKRAENVRGCHKMFIKPRNKRISGRARVDRWNGNEGKGHTKVIYLLKTLDIIK